jgi:hypothetical protein
LVTSLALAVLLRRPIFSEKPDVSLINENNIRKILDTGVEYVNTTNSFPYRFA